MLQTFTSMQGLLVSVLLLLLLSCCECHQFISYPTPISKLGACRMDGQINCPGPCPNQRLRPDQHPDNPSTTVKRGDTLTVHISKNNHLGGFSRWTLVKVGDMNDRKKHDRGAFLFTCTDTNVAKCTRRNKERDCRVDKLNEYFRHYVEIPKIYPNGNYVLGWTWYGGITKAAMRGSFGDYYDCMYLRIEGGPESDSHQPKFDGSNSYTGRRGLCKATVDRLGICRRQPCRGGSRMAQLQKPHEFKRSSPRRILRKSYE